MHKLTGIQILNDYDRDGYIFTIFLKDDLNIRQDTCVGMDFSKRDDIDTLTEKFEKITNALKSVSCTKSVCKKRVGIYAGSFYPFHKGHRNVLEKAEKLFDEVILVQAHNPEKNLKGSEFDNIKDVIKNKIVHLPLGTFLAEFIKEHNADCEAFLIRGFRDSDDIKYEMKQNFYNKKLYDEISVVYIASDQEYQHISSSDIRALEGIRKGMGAEYL